MELHDLGDFTHLSEQLTYQRADPGGWANGWLRILVDRRPISPADKVILLDVLSYLEKAYEGRTRLIGSLSVLHPLRAAAFLVRARGGTHLLDLLTVLLHDKREDLPSEGDIEEQFNALLKRIDPTDEWYLMERLAWLTREPTESYFTYVGRVLDHASATPELMRVKLADRLDNILDLRIAGYDVMPVDRFYRLVFRILNDRSFGGFVPEEEHPDPGPINGAGRLYQLFKGVVVLTLIRERGIPLDEPAERLFCAMARAGMAEAMRTVLHIWGYHLTSVAQQRELLVETMHYAYGGGLDRVTRPSDDHPLDGLFLKYFDDGDKKKRLASLARLYDDKPLMVRASLAFVLIFTRLLDDPQFCLRGVSIEGLKVE